MYIRILSRRHNELARAASAARRARRSCAARTSILLALGAGLAGCNVYDASLLKNLHPALERAGVVVDAGSLGCDASEELGCQDAQPDAATTRPACNVESPDRESCDRMVPNGTGMAANSVPPSAPITEADGGDSATPAKPEQTDKPRRPNYTWAELMRRTFAIDVLACQHCGGRLRLLTVVLWTLAALRGTW